MASITFAVGVVSRNLAGTTSTLTGDSRTPICSSVPVTTTAPDS